MWDVSDVLKTIKRTDVSDVLSWDFVYSRIVFLMKIITFNLLNLLSYSIVNTIIYWLRDSLNYWTHLLNLVHWNSYINKIKISRFYICEIADWNVTLWTFLQYKNDHLCTEVSFDKLDQFSEYTTFKNIKNISIWCLH